MPNLRLPPDVHVRILEFRKQGLSTRQIAKKLGISHGVAHKYSHLGPAVLSNKKVGEFKWREWTPWIKHGQELRHKASSSQERAEIQLGDGKSPVILATLSDMHIGAWGADYDGLIQFTDEIVKTPNLYVALLGDYTEHAIKLRNVMENCNQVLPPEQQTAFLESWFDEIWPKVAWASWENHAIERGEKLAGESPIKNMLSKKVTYFNGIAHIEVRVGKELYKVACSHKFTGRSFLNPIHAAQRYMRMEGHDRELAMMGDTHVPGMCKYTDGDKVRVAINTGSLHRNSGYAKRYFSLTTHPVFPCVVLYPDVHRMVPFWSVAEALPSL